MQHQFATRKLIWSGCWNARDLGGLATVDGPLTRYGEIYRSDALTRLTPDGVDQVREARVGLVIDLREPHQVARELHPFQNSPDVAYRNIPLVSADFPHPVEPDLCARALVEARSALAEIVSVIGGSQRAVVFHCHSGSGRTGVVAIVLLALARVASDAIVEDFALSARPGATGPRPVGKPWGSETRDVVKSGLDVFEQLQSLGGPETFLRAGGASEQHIHRVRTRLSGSFVTRSEPF